MRNFHIKKNTLKHYCPTINVENLWSLLGNEAREHYAKEKGGKAPVINLVKHVCKNLPLTADYALLWPLCYIEIL